MPNSHDACLVDEDVDAQAGNTFPPQWSDRPAPSAALLSGALLSACGGGGDSAGRETPPPPVAAPPSAIQASRFLAQASMGACGEQIARVQTLGLAGWLDEQFAMPASQTRWDWMLARGLNAVEFKFNDSGADACQWAKMLSSPDTLRQRVTLALSEIVVGSVSGFLGHGWSAFAAAHYLDLLEANAFGNYRTLLHQVSQSAPMADYLTFRGSLRFDTERGDSPDENYARELMQLFTIGLVHLNLDGSPKLTSGLPTETYKLDDVAGLARVFTGWNYDFAGGPGTSETPDFKRRPLSLTPQRHESGPKTFLGATIPAGTDAVKSLNMALDIIIAHPNVGPFISRQLIQRLVCSNPSGAYVARIATVFNNDGRRVKGNLKAVIKAILLDDEARNEAGLQDPAFGKVREPILRFAAWARAFDASSPSGQWAIGNTSDAGTRLGQSPLRSGSVFNFFRPGYVPPNSLIASAGLVAPELQITNETTVIGYVNYMQTAISQGVADVKGDYTALMPLADNAQALMDHINLVLAAGQLSEATLDVIKGGIDPMATGTDAARLNRIHAALVMVMAAPEFIVQK